MRGLKRRLICSWRGHAFPIAPEPLHYSTWAPIKQYKVDGMLWADQPEPEIAWRCTRCATLVRM